MRISCIFDEVEKEWDEKEINFSSVGEKIS